MKTLLFIIVSMFSFVSVDASAGFEGAWQCSGVMKQDLYDNVTGAYITTQTIHSNAQTTFYNDGTFESRSALPIVGRGHWSKRKNMVYATADLDSLVESMEYGCSLAGNECTVLSAFSQTVGKKVGRKIKSNGSLNYTVFFPGTNRMLYAKGKGTSICAR